MIDAELTSYLLAAFLCWEKTVIILQLHTGKLSSYFSLSGSSN